MNQVLIKFLNISWIKSQIWQKVIVKRHGKTVHYNLNTITDKKLFRIIWFAVFLKLLIVFRTGSVKMIETIEWVEVLTRLFNHFPYIRG